MSQTAPFGKWESTITTESIAQDRIFFTDLFVDPTNDHAYHIELRPKDNDRHVVVDTLAAQDVLPAPYSARSSVQESGGAAAAVYAGTLYFSNAADNCVYSVKTDGESQPEPVTPDNPKYGYANFIVHPKRHDLLVSILEDHTIGTLQTVITTLCVINTNRKATFPLVVGADFYAAPVFNPSGTRIAWQEWYHPDMPWEGSLVYVADVLVQQDTIVVLNKTHVGGERLTKSVGSPTWASETTLVFTSDELNGFQNPFVYSAQTSQARLAIREPIQQDIGGFAWSLGDNPCATLDDGRFAAFVAYRDGRNVLFVVDLSDTSKNAVEVHDFPFSVANHVIANGGSSIIFIASRSDAPDSIVLCTFSGASFVPSYKVLKSSAPQAAPGSEAYISHPQPITLYKDGKPLHVVYYAPKNPKYSGSSIPGEKPPCIVHAHGGPVGLETQALSWEKQYYTSRGYAWLDVNHSGSLGYGREYISRLTGNWGIVDVQECKDAPRMLAADPYSLIDGARVAMRGISAGGFTTLAALSIGPDPGFFKAATSLYGVSDLALLAKVSMHKFVLGFINRLLCETPEKVPEVYAARSPVHHAEGIVTPLLVLQGADDKVVLPEQAEKIVEMIVAHGGKDRVKYRLFEGEGHGWQRPETIKEAVALEHAWYDQKLL